MSQAAIQFSLLDYFFFSLVFLVTIGIGLFYALRKKSHSIDEFLFGGKNLSIFPVAFSLVATSISGSSIIGQSMEVYAYGLHNWIYLPMGLLTTLIMQFIFLPMFFELQLVSTFTYFEMRFDRSVKHVASTLYIVTGILLIPLTIYVPALAFQEVTGINLYLITMIMGSICIWYTAIGGIRAVVWTDAFQCILILISGGVIFIVGLRSVGGIANVWEALGRGERLTIIKTDFNLETRGTIWSYIFSNIYIKVYLFGINQSFIQRYVALPDISKAKKALWLSSLFCNVTSIIQIIVGGIIYTSYENCDPLSAGIVKKIDQIFPYFVQERASLFEGFNGIFIAGITSAGLSTTSTLLNTIGGTIYSDFVSTRITDTSERTFSRIIRTISVVVGLIGIALVFVIERMGTIFAITSQCFTLSTVAVFGLFANGMFIPKINARGAKCGVVCAMIVVGILTVIGLSKNPDPVLPLRTDGCSFLNSTSTVPSFSPMSNSSITKFAPRNDQNDDLPWIFRINFQFYCLIGIVINLSVGYIVSILSGGNEVKNQKLLVSFLRNKTPQDLIMNCPEMQRLNI
ncbi:sodium-coupled monocarboxylate transporter 1-like isoform X1 [Lutzomyia longipalpis]|uniref:sodium-coupled monocarboxylate transporter 1-like isoform X1 n=1 Tax=Lutzomyia longipalpis TaxID=7200 RepID=UPI0024838048|nr:sodium-coupled monocarboxylate transporter 1-like isoform X1 [Lutzomyia longipalpis]